MGLMRLFSVTLLALGLFLLGRDAAGLFAGRAVPEALGDLWYRLDPAGLNAVQDAIERYLLPEIWNPGVTTLLSLPAWALPIGIGLALMIADIFSQRRGRTKP